MVAVLARLLVVMGTRQAFHPHKAAMAAGQIILPLTMVLAVVAVLLRREQQEHQQPAEMVALEPHRPFLVRLLLMLAVVAVERLLEVLLAVAAQAVAETQALLVVEQARLELLIPAAVVAEEVLQTLLVITQAQQVAQVS